LIATLRGQVNSVTSDSAIIEVHGVGYLVHMPFPALEELRRRDGEVFIHTYQYVREDIISLYGFLNPEEKALFIQVIGVSGIGPKTGLAMLSVLPADRLRDVVRREDAKSLSAVPGIGLKTAQRLILELKSKMGKAVGTSAAGSMPENASAGGGIFNDAVDALLALGYGMADALRVVEESIRDNPAASTGDTVRDALKRLTKK
jgi:Holliday junction DNA helicase RuvA